MYITTAFSVVQGKSYKVVSTNPNAPLSTIDFNFGLAYVGTIGYSLNDFLAIEGTMDYGSRTSPNRYFDPYGYRNSEAGTNSGVLPLSTTEDVEYLKDFSFFLNGVGYMDTGENFMLYAGGGFGISAMDLSGFSASSIGYDAFAGGDLLMVPKFSMYVEVRYQGFADPTFQTKHVVKNLSTDPVPPYLEESYEDTLQDLSWVRLDLGVKLGF